MLPRGAVPSSYIVSVAEARSGARAASPAQANVLSGRARGKRSAVRFAAGTTASGCPRSDETVSPSRNTNYIDSRPERSLVATYLSWMRVPATAMNRLTSVATNLGLAAKTIATAHHVSQTNRSELSTAASRDL